MSKVNPLAIQQGDENSIFNHYKNLIQIRKSHQALWMNGNIEPMDVNTNKVVAFVRQHGNERFLVFQNVANESVTISINENWSQKIYTFKNVNITKNNIELSPYAMIILQQ